MHFVHHARSFNSAQRLDIGCFEFLGWWWIAYFLLSYRDKTRMPRWYELFTLRSYLDNISSHRGRPGSEEPKFGEHDLMLREKATSSRDVQGIMIAVVVLMLTLARNIQ